MPTPKYKCPQCLSTDTLEVVVEVFAKINQSDADNIETDIDEAQDQSHDWGDESSMICRVCSYSDQAKAFKPFRTLVKELRDTLAFYGISAPESDDELLSFEKNYHNKILRTIARKGSCYD
jgi:hypothetical protein